MLLCLWVGFELVLASCFCDLLFIAVGVGGLFGDVGLLVGCLVVTAVLVWYIGSLVFCCLCVVLAWCYRLLIGAGVCTVLRGCFVYVCWVLGFVVVACFWVCICWLWLICIVRWCLICWFDSYCCGRFDSFNSVVLVVYIVVVCIFIVWLCALDFSFCICLLC